MEDLFALEEWRRHSPDVPQGLWYKDFGSFKLCAEGPYPKTFLYEVSLRLAKRSTSCGRSVGAYFPQTVVFGL